MPHAYRFGRFELLALQRSALADGQPLVLGARALDVLLALVQRGGELISKEELLQCVWPGLVVEEANVHVQISLLRKALGAQAIATVAGLGYRFALPITEVSGMPPHNLPAARTPFIGRVAALTEAEQRLRGTRVLTFIGIGGSGKTRLALRLAEQLLPAFEQGIWFVDLASLEDAAQVPIALARTLGVAQDANTTLEQDLLDKLRCHHALLIFDNCEHLLDAVAALAGVLLGGAPELKILCTSREALGLAGEVIFAVPPLALPPADADALTTAAAEAVQLFIERARAAAPGLGFDAGSLPWVAHICRRLDGIPLALELAAARLKMLSVTQVSALLDERFELLTGGARAVPRQQTLQAVIHWSYEHLAAAEQRLLRVLSVCSGGCDLAAAVALQGDATDEPGAQAMVTLDSLARLVDQSLLTVQHHARAARYEMLESVRQYVLERLGDGGEVAAVRDRHLGHFLALAEEMDQQLTGERPGAWIARLDLERDNLFRALAWCDGAGREQSGLRMVVALRHYWPSRGLLVRGYEVTMAALARPGAQERGLWRCKGLSAAAEQSSMLGHYQQAGSLAEASLAIARETGDAERSAIALRQMAMASLMVGDTKTARRHGDEALALARQIGNDLLICGLLSGMALLHMHEGEYAQAEPLFVEVLFLHKRSNHPCFAKATAVLNLAAVAIGRRMPEIARARLLEAAALAEHADSRFLGQHLVDEVSALAALSGHFELAVRLRAASVRQREEVDMAAHRLGREQKRDLAQARQALGAAACAAAEQAGRGMRYEQVSTEALDWLRLPPPHGAAHEPRQATDR